MLDCLSVSVLKMSLLTLSVVAGFIAEKVSFVVPALFVRWPSKIIGFLLAWFSEALVRDL